MTWTNCVSGRSRVVPWTRLPDSPRRAMGGGPRPARPDRRTYLRQQNGQLWGRPPDGVAAKFLLTGIGRCGLCGGGLEVRSRSNGRGKRRSHYYGCSVYHRRGKSVCSNRAEIPMASADAAVVSALLDDLLTAERLAEVADRAVALAGAEHEAAPDLRAGIERQLGECEAALGRLTAAVAAGGDVPALVEAIKAQETQRQRLEARLDTLAAPAPAFDLRSEERLREAVEEWREVLGRQVPLARQVLAKLLEEKVSFVPEDRKGRRGFRFRAAGTVERLVAGAVPGLVRAVVAPTGFEPVFPP